MDVARARYLVSDEGREALREFGPVLRGRSVNERATRLRRVLTPEAAAAIGEQLALRERANGRIEEPERWLLTADGFEMMTHPLVARRRAARLAATGLTVTDLTCGLGGDLHALAAAGIATAGIDRDPVAALLAAHNTGAPVAIGDAGRPPIAVERVAVLIDPSRRADGRRVFDPAAFTPDWNAALAVASAARAGAVKAPPGLPHQQIPPAAEAEFIQAGRSMREATLWFGAGAVPGLRRAVRLRADGVEAALDSTMAACEAEVAPVDRFVFDPESCVTRAGLVRQLGAAIGGQLLDPQVAYLTAGAPAASPLAAAFEVLEVLPFSVGRLKALLRERRWRPEEIRRRAFPIEPDELRKLLGRIDGEPVTLLCTTIGGRRTVIVAAPHRAETTAAAVARR